MERKVAYFGNCTGLLAILEKQEEKSQLYYWKMLQLSLFQKMECQRCYRHFQKSGIVSNGFLYELLISDYPTKEKESSGVAMLPTPTAHLSKEIGAASEYKRKTPSLISIFQKYEKNPKKRKILNPQFVEKIMGYPVDYTKID